MLRILALSFLLLATGLAFGGVGESDAVVEPAAACVPPNCGQSCKLVVPDPRSGTIPPRLIECYY